MSEWTQTSRIPHHHYTTYRTRSSSPSIYISIPTQAMDAAALLIQAARRESAPVAAALIEQAAWSYLRGGNLRKFAFHVAMAGQMYLAAAAASSVGDGRGGGGEGGLDKVSGGWMGQ